jgi:hypothetical protein
MTTTSIIQEINRLPLSEKVLLFEYLRKSISLEREHDLEAAVAIMQNEYRSDKELTAFTTFDLPQGN